jgi:DivIVA domain-containing protein
VIAAALHGRSRLSANDVHNVAFKKPPVGRRGYDEEQVDAFLDAIEDQLRTRERSTGAAANRSTRSTTAFAETPPAANDPTAAAAAADAAWYEAKFGSARPSTTSPDTSAPRGLVAFSESAHTCDSANNTRQLVLTPKHHIHMHALDDNTHALAARHGI